MNYRHAFHAGNFADVFKHAVLARVLAHLRAKPTAFRAIDTHAGAGRYDLTGPQASRSLEWQRGIQRLHGAPIGDNLRGLLAPYLDVVSAFNQPGRLTCYPGSPAIMQALLRPRDRLIACELEPKAAAALTRELASDRRAKVVAIDGFVALKAYVPPPERRGVVLIDPPFERPDEFERLAQGLVTAHRKWATGIYLLWYPIKGHAEPDTLARRLARTGIGGILRAELEVGGSDDGDRLAGCGLIVVNPPWTLADELKLILPALAATLAAPARGAYHLDWLAPER